MDPRTEFQAKISQHHKNFEELLHSRAIDFTANEEISEASILRRLQDYYGKLPVGLLFYFHESGTLKIWILGTDGTFDHAEREVSEKELDQLETRLKSGLGISRLMESRAPHLRGIKVRASEVFDDIVLETVTGRLSELLFPQPISGRLSSFEHLIIIPALNIQQIPLGILTPPESGRLLIEQCSYAFAPSIFDLGNTLYQRAREGRSSEKTRFTFGSPLIVGNPDFYQGGKWFLPPLPGSEQEARAVAKETGAKGSDLLTGTEATLERILKKIQSADFLYFATHGIADEEKPLDGGGLMLTPCASDPDGFWSTREIQYLRLRADLVVLSACQTGLGKQHNAGVIGLTRAFQLAGVGNVIMSLWSIDDLATREFMEIFIRELLRPGFYFPGGALRSAMLKYRERRPAPVYWAPFAVFGVAV